MLFNPEISTFGGVRSSLAVRPPTDLYLPQGDIRDAWAAQNPFPKAARPSAAQRSGLAYQKRVDTYLSSRSGQWSVVSSPWYAYHDGSASRHYCSPDFLLLDTDNKCCVIVEVKLSWTPIAWWQLSRLYFPVLRHLYPEFTMLRLCICKRFDPAIPVFEPVNLISDLMDTRPDLFNVLIYKG